MMQYFKPKYSVYNCLNVYGDILYQPAVKYWFWPARLALGMLWDKPADAQSFLLKFTKEITI